MDCRILGTPTIAKWPGFAEYPESQDKSYLLDCAPVKFEVLFPTLEPAGLDLLSVTILFFGEFSGLML